MNFRGGIANGSAGHLWARQWFGLRSGERLARHIASAHNGVVDAACPACQEIQRKMRLVLDDDKRRTVTA